LNSKLIEYKNKLKEMDLENLEKELLNSKKELFSLRFLLATNQSQEFSKIKIIKKNVARIKTFITQKNKKV
jgi:large subunit ribosomal protein L29